MKNDVLKNMTLEFIARQKSGGELATYRYSAVATKPTLYSSAYAVMARSLYGDLESLSDAQRRAWVDYFHRHQADDGLFRDPAIWDEGWYKGDPFWCGRPHLTCHVLTALMCLGAVAKRPFRLIEQFRNLRVLRTWLEDRDWGDGIAFAGNEILNLGTLLQYARDFQADTHAGDMVETILDWLDGHHVNPNTGLWDHQNLSDPRKCSEAAQAAYHWWLLYFYDRRPIPFPERVIDTLLSMQNPEGSFGWGVHNQDAPYHGSACEDIDAIDPLARLCQYTEYCRTEIHRSLERARQWVLRNQTPDGGFTFLLDQPFEYGHPELRSEQNFGAMFPTWFRTLTLAMIDNALPGRSSWHFTRCPGIQFGS